MLKYYRLGTCGLIARSCLGKSVTTVSNTGLVRHSSGNCDDVSRLAGVLSVPISESHSGSAEERQSRAFRAQALRGFCTGTASDGHERFGSSKSVGAANQSRTLGLNEFMRIDQNAEPESESEKVPYVSEESLSGHGRKVFIKTYGCQMNVNDTEIAWGILQQNGFEKVNSADESDVILMVTCSVRERAEEKVWGRLEYFKHLKKMRRYDKTKVPLKIGILGCMAERLKKTIIDKEPMVDVICGPDAYRDLPRMLSLTDQGQAAVNVLLSLDETYADVMPVRVNSKGPSAFVSIMRGCDNMCSYCIVPFTRGRERSRPLASILDEIRALSDQGVKEVMLLGQNVNSYRDTSEMTSHGGYDVSSVSNHSKGFTPIYKPKLGGRRFSDLLDQVSDIDPEMRIRFTSPHPKDFPDEVLYLIRERTNICKQLHLPAQSGSSRVLETMRRGYTREAYLELVQHIRALVPGVSLSSDFIAGFCGETEEDHEATLSLIKLVKYNFAYCFAYSMRQKTRAHHRLNDDVPTKVKNRRHLELVAAFRDAALELNRAEIGKKHLVLVEGVSKRTDLELAGRTDGGTKVILPQMGVSEDESSSTLRPINVGDYLAVKIVDASSQVLRGSPLFHSSLQRGVLDSESSQMSSERTARLKS